MVNISNILHSLTLWTQSFFAIYAKFETLKPKSRKAAKYDIYNKHFESALLFNVLLPEIQQDTFELAQNLRM